MLVRPYVVLKGMAAELITEGQRRRFQKREWEKEITPSDFGTSEQSQLF